MSLLSNPIPSFSLEKDLEIIYPNHKEAQVKRYQDLRALFVSKYNAEPDFYARSPGRVNLIGEHIDYSGYSVLPMAIERDTVMAVKAIQQENAFVELVNVNSKYPARRFEHEKDVHVTIDSSQHEWSNYFKCGYKGVMDELNPKNPVSLQIAVDGIVPTGSGLSSSSAFVCCSSLATLHGNKASMNKGELTQTAIKSETYAGVQIGGMDQSISIMAPKGAALLIDFYPKLNATQILIPQSDPAPIFVIANTMVTADKHVTAPRNYNLRVVETRFAAAVLNLKLGLGLKQSIPTLIQVQEAYAKKIGKTMVESFDLMLKETETHFRKTAYSLQDVALELNQTVEELKKVYIGSIRIEQELGFKLCARSKHVFSEAGRVYQFRDICAAAPSDLLVKLGALMNDSHSSCKEIFECSCPELDELTSLCRQEGAFGSRLTGAGWGGCTVSLVAQSNVDNFIKQIREKYYFKNFPEWKNDPKAIKALDGYLFASQPGIGALILN